MVQLEERYVCSSKLSLEPKVLALYAQLLKKPNIPQESLWLEPLEQECPGVLNAAPSLKLNFKLNGFVCKLIRNLECSVSDYQNDILSLLCVEIAGHHINPCVISKMYADMKTEQSVFTVEDAVATYVLRHYNMANELRLKLFMAAKLRAALIFMREHKSVIRALYFLMHSKLETKLSEGGNVRTMVVLRQTPDCMVAFVRAAKLLEQAFLSYYPNANLMYEKNPNFFVRL